MKMRVVVAALLVVGQSLALGCRHVGGAGPPGGPAAATPAPQAPPAAVPVVLGPGDEVAISVWRNTDLSCDARVDPDGNISVPLAGEVHVAGLGLPELRATLVERLAKYLVNPQVRVNLTTLRSRKVHVLGEVKEPGTFVLDETVGLWEAIAKAGGFNADANRRHVLWVHNDAGVGRVAAIDLQAFLEVGGQVPMGLIQGGDVIYVLPTKLASVERFMVRLQNMLLPVLAFEGGIVLGQQAKDVLEGKNDSSKGIIIAR